MSTPLINHKRLPTWRLLYYIGLAFGLLMFGSTLLEDTPPNGSPFVSYPLSFASGFFMILPVYILWCIVAIFIAGFKGELVDSRYSPTISTEEEIEYYRKKISGAWLATLTDKEVVKLIDTKDKYTNERRDVYDKSEVVKRLNLQGLAVNEDQYCELMIAEEGFLREKGLLIET